MKMAQRLSEKRNSSRTLKVLNVHFNQYRIIMCINVQLCYSCRFSFSFFSPLFRVIFIQGYAGSYFYCHKSESFRRFTDQTDNPQKERNNVCSPPCFHNFMQVFSRIREQPARRRSTRRAPRTRLCYGLCLRCPRWSWSPFPRLRFHLPRSCRTPAQTPAPPTFQRPLMPQLHLPSRAATLTGRAQMENNAQMTTRTLSRARLTSTAPSVKSQSTPSPSWKRTTAVRTPVFTSECVA